MKDKLMTVALWAFVSLFALLVGAGLWYYTLGRKPKLVISSRISEKAGMPSSHTTAPGEVLLISNGKVTLYDTMAAKPKWTTDMAAASATIAATPVPTPATTTVQKPLGTLSQDKNDPMRQMAEGRIARRTAKLREWEAKLSAKRNSLDTPLKVASFKEEEAKYQAELDEVRAAKLTLQSASGPSGPYALEDPREQRLQLDENAFGYERREVFRDPTVIVVVQGRRVCLFDPANGRLTKEISLPGGFQQVMKGENCVYIRTSGDTGAQQIHRIKTTDGSDTVLDLTGIQVDSESELLTHASTNGPPVSGRRMTFGATGSELASLDVRLVEKKITERKALKGDSASDWEAADKNTTGGWANDAAVIAQAINNDAQREMTGGVELVDESTYEVVLRRPFNSQIPETPPLRVQGRPSLFSTASVDLVAAGKSLIAFDHGNKKLWETALAFPVASASFVQDDDAAGPGSLSQPCIEDEKRLYFFDRGFLNAFDRQTGATLWRLPSVGIQKVQLDSGGMFDSGPVLYVSSLNGNPETLQYSQQSATPTLPIIFKLDAASGKILWKVDKYQDCFVSGGNVYATLETRNASDFVDSVFQRGKAIATRFKLYKLSARNGHPQWEWFQTRKPLRINADKKKVSLLFSDELQVLTSRAL